MGALKGWHIVAVLVVVLLLFGAPKLPELARSLGKSLHILKEEAQSLTSDNDKNNSDAGTASTSASDTAASNKAADASPTDVSGNGDTEASGK